MRGILCLKEKDQPSGSAVDGGNIASKMSSCVSGNTIEVRENQVLTPRPPNYNVDWQYFVPAETPTIHHNIA